MSSHVDVLGSAATAVVLLMVITWFVSLARRDASIADIVWGLGFVVIAWITWWVGDGLADRRGLLVAMVTIWGVRLVAHLTWRSRSEPEDFRYASMRRRAGERFPITSLFSVFLFQGAVMFIVSLPVQLAMTPAQPQVGILAIVGVVVWGVGLFFETVADAQLTRFRNDPGNAGAVLDWGLWRYTRHPNYFGDACIWWGIYLVAADTTDARWAIISPILMTVMLLRVTGVTMLERGLRTRRDGYADYVARTSAFLPRPPKGQPS
ncbi:MAG: DUF1295 domain-containing protein [Actinomycetota bacterium]